MSRRDSGLGAGGGACILPEEEEWVTGTPHLERRNTTRPAAPGCSVSTMLHTGSQAAVALPPAGLCICISTEGKTAPEALSAEYCLGCREKEMLKMLFYTHSGDVFTFSLAPFEYGDRMGHGGWHL